MRVAVMFEDQGRANWASDSLLGSGTLEHTDAVSVVRGGEPTAVAEPTQPRGLGPVIALGLGCAMLMTFAIEGFTPLALVTAIALALGWGALYGVLAGALNTANTAAAARERPKHTPRPRTPSGIVVVESDSPESLQRARRYLMSCAGAAAVRNG